LSFLGTSAWLLAPLYAVAHPLTHTGVITRLGVEGEVKFSIRPTVDLI
jgi:hypothetical protein